MCPHYKVTPISRANGGSIVERANYALCRGQHADKAAELVASGQAGPVIDWPAIAAAEDKSTRRATAKEGRTFVIALPNELDLPSLIQLAQEHADWLRAEFGFVVEWGIQIDPGNPLNPHLHMATSSRVVDDEGRIGKKVRVLDQVQTGAARIEAMRHQWENQVNAAMEAAGRPERLDMRSFVRQGRQDEPTRHLGPLIAHRVEKGLPSLRHARNKSIQNKRAKHAAAERAEREYQRDVRHGADRAIARGRGRVGSSQRLVATAARVRTRRRAHTGPGVWVGNVAANPQRQEHQSALHGGGADPEHRAAEVLREVGDLRGRDELDGLAGGTRSPGAVRPGPGGVGGRTGTTKAPGLRPDDQELIGRAKRTVDLPGFLAEHGFRVAIDKDSRRHRVLDGPGGQRVRVTQAASGDWVWADLRGEGGGNIVHACQRLLGMSFGRTLGALRKATKNPPPALPVARMNPATATATGQPSRPPRSLLAVGDRGRIYWQSRHLDASTLDAFAHAIRENAAGSIVFPHNNNGDGEERGENWRSFYGSRDDGVHRGRSLHVAVPQDIQEPPKRLIVAESGISGYSAWEMLPEEIRSTTGVASTGGQVSEAGRAKLERALRRMVEHHGNPILIDATDTGEQGTEARTAWLKRLAERVGAQYFRAAPTAKDWNEELANTKAESQETTQAAQEATSDLQGAESYPSVSDGLEEGRGRRRDGRGGRGR